jgi:hypothetical protein
MTIMALAGLLGGCGESASYRYKLTLAVETPDGIKTASGVSEVRIKRVSMPAEGTPSKLTGEAIYLDLGPGRRPLIALLSNMHYDKSKDRFGEFNHWFEGRPSVKFLLELYEGKRPKDEDPIEMFRRVSKHRGAQTIPSDVLPDLVTLNNIGVPKSVQPVDPKKLEEAFGIGVKWHKITIEITDEPITIGILQKLPWLKSPIGSLIGGRVYELDPWIKKVTDYEFRRGLSQ